MDQAASRYSVVIFLLQLLTALCGGTIGSYLAFEEVRPSPPLRVEARVRARMGGGCGFPEPRGRNPTVIVPTSIVVLRHHNNFLR